MIPPKIPNNEKQRLQSLKLTGLLDTLPEEDYDDITKLAAFVTNAKMATISLVDADRQWFKSRCGVDMEQSTREISFCGHTINEINGYLEINDALKDDRFRDNPFVTESPYIRFYAGATIKSPSGFPIGTLCVFDETPKQLTEPQKVALLKLAKQVERMIKTRLTNIELKKTKYNLSKKNQELQQFTYTISHDLKSPIYGINSLLRLIKEEHFAEMGAELQEMITLLSESSENLSEFVTNLVTFYSQNKGQSYKSRGAINLRQTLEDIIILVDPHRDFNFSLPASDINLAINETVLDQLMINLLSNAIKYSGDSKEIKIEFNENETHYFLSVIDFGIGIKKADQKKIFNLFSTLGKKDRYDNLGTGVGLATVKKLVQNLGGKIELTSELGKGSKFLISIKKPKE